MLTKLFLLSCFCILAEVLSDGEAEVLPDEEVVVCDEKACDGCFEKCRAINRTHLGSCFADSICKTCHCGPGFCFRGVNKTCEKDCDNKCKLDSKGKKKGVCTENQECGRTTCNCVFIKCDLQSPCEPKECDSTCKTNVNSEYEGKCILDKDCEKELCKCGPTECYSDLNIECDKKCAEHCATQNGTKPKCVHNDTCGIPVCECRDQCSWDENLPCEDACAPYCEKIDKTTEAKCVFNEGCNKPICECRTFCFHDKNSPCKNDTCYNHDTCGRSGGSCVDNAECGKPTCKCKPDYCSWDGICDPESDVCNTNCLNENRNMLGGECYKDAVCDKSMCRCLHKHCLEATNNPCIPENCVCPTGSPIGICLPNDYCLRPICECIPQFCIEEPNHTDTCDKDACSAHCKKNDPKDGSECRYDGRCKKDVCQCKGH